VEPPNSPSECPAPKPQFGFMGDYIAAARDCTVGGGDRSLTVPGDIYGPVEQGAHPLAMMSFERVAAAGW